MADIEIEIDGQKLNASPDQTVIQVADAAGIYIPRFCYHKHLSIPANCRMCLVEIEKAPKALPACATPVMPGMKVFTKSSKTLAAQRAVMEFLLINHPLDCPICDQGGECELQDLAMGYGSPWSHYDECKRSLPDQDLGPLIATDMTRCITCTRCVRFGTEVAGITELGALGRGEHTEISTYVQHAMQSEISGNIIDLCPVGALTSKPYRFKARPWELEQAPSISPHDCLGANINVHTRYGTVLRVVARENAEINETWISDRDRFSYEGLYHPDRLDKPLARIGGKLQTVEWQQALQLAASGLQEVISKGSDKLGALASPNSTVEEFYLLQKILRGLGASNIDHRLREVDMQDQAQMPAFPGLNISLEALEQCDAIILIGCNIQKEQPLLTTRIRKAIAKGADVISINPIDYAFNFKLKAKYIVPPQGLQSALAELINLISDNTFPEVNPTDDARHCMQALHEKKNICIMLGNLAYHHMHASAIRYLAQQLNEKLPATLGYLTAGANTAGAWLAGAVPHREVGGVAVEKPGLDAYNMLMDARDGYLLINVEPELDFANSSLAISAMQSASMVIAISQYRNPILEKYAHVILPMAAFTETSGSYVNVCGEWQSFKGVAKSFGESRPAWKILRALGSFLQLNGFNYESSEEVKQEMYSKLEKMPSLDFKFNKSKTFIFNPDKNLLMRIGEIPIYAVDSLVRRSPPLQAAMEFMQEDLSYACLHPETAQQLQINTQDSVIIKQNNAELKMRLKLDARIAKNALRIYGGIADTSTLGDLFGKVLIKKDSVN